jgi:hypothetical protein
MEDGEAMRSRATTIGRAAALVVVGLLCWACDAGTEPSARRGSPPATPSSIPPSVTPTPSAPMANPWDVSPWQGKRGAYSRVARSGDGSLLVTWSRGNNWTAFRVYTPHLGPATALLRLESEIGAIVGLPRGFLAKARPGPTTGTRAPTPDGQPSVQQGTRRQSTAAGAWTRPGQVTLP